MFESKYSTRVTFTKHCLLAGLLLTCLFSCNSEPSMQVRGEWQIINAATDGRPTKSLDEGTFTFLDDAHMQSNMFPGNDTLTYELKGSTMLIGDTPPYTFYLSEIRPDTMHVEARILKRSFSFDLVRAPK